MRQGVDKGDDGKPLTPPVGAHSVRPRAIDDRPYTGTMDLARAGSVLYAPDALPDRPWDGEDFHPLFAEALRNWDYWEELYLSVLVAGSFRQKLKFYQTHGKEVSELAKRIDTIAED